MPITGDKQEFLDKYDYENTAVTREELDEYVTRAGFNMFLVTPMPGTELSDYQVKTRSLRHKLEYPIGIPIVFYQFIKYSCISSETYGVTIGYKVRYGTLHGTAHGKSI